MLRLENVSVSFGGIAALTAVEFGLEEGAILGLVGPNGAGKTTLFNVISGLVPATTGLVHFRGRSLNGMPAHKRVRTGIGRSFQIPQPLHELTVKENLIVGQHFGGGGRDSKKIDHLLDVLNLRSKADSDAATALTLVERKALEIGKALSTDPKLLMLDEVFAGLETQGKKVFSDLIHLLLREWKLSVIMIEHDMDTIRRICERAIVLDFGRIIADGSPEAVFQDPAVVRSYTGVGATDA